MAGVACAACYLFGAIHNENNSKYNNYEYSTDAEQVKSETTGWFSSRKVVQNKTTGAVEATVYGPVPFRFTFNQKMYGLDWHTVYRTKDSCSLDEVIMERPWGSDYYCLEDAETKSFRNAEEDLQNVLEDLGLLNCGGKEK